MKASDIEAGYVVEFDNGHGQTVSGEVVSFVKDWPLEGSPVQLVLETDTWRSQHSLAPDFQVVFLGVA